MNNKKPDSLFQSMEKWIDLYRGINTCTHDQAHDAFEAWAEKLRGESSDQTTTLFHEAVKASFEEMLKGVLQVSSEDGWMERTLNQAKRIPRPSVSEMLGSPKGFLIPHGSWLERNLKDHPETLARIVELTGQGTVSHDHSAEGKLFAPGSLDRAVDIDDDIVIEFNVKTQDPIDLALNPQVGIKESGVIGGPLLELSYGRQPPRRPFGKAEFGGPAPIGVPDNAPIGGPLLDTGKDPLSFKDEYNPENLHWGQKTTSHETDVSALEERVVKELLGCSNPMPKIDTADEARKKAEDAIELNTGFLINTKHPADHPSVVKAREVIAAARTFLVMLGGVEERAKDRKTLSLKR